MFEVGAAHLANPVPGALLALPPARAPQLEPEGDVGEDGTPGKKGEVSEDESAFGSRPARPSTFDSHLSRRRFDGSGDDLEQPGLAATRRTEKRGELAPGNVGVDVREREHLPVVDLAEAAHLHDRPRRTREDPRVPESAGGHPARRPGRNSRCSGRSRKPRTRTAKVITVTIAAYICGYSATD